MKSPFIKHEGQWYRVIGWENRIDPGDEIRLRPLSVEETDVLERYLDDTLNEAWAVIMGGGQ